MEKVSSILARHMKKWGVTHIFGIPGKAIVPLLLEIDTTNIEFILSKHESGAGFEAAGYSLLSNSLGVAVGTSGPGGTNLITAAAQAKAFHIPVLIITGHPSIKDVGKALGQDSTLFGTDLVEMFRPVTKFSVRIERGDQVKSYLSHALEKAFSGVKGPVHLSIPADVLTEEIEPFEMNLPESQHVVSSNYHEVIDVLNNAKRPALILGKGVHSSKAYEEVRRIAEVWGIPVMTTPGGKGTFPSKHSLSLGAYGLGGTDESEAYVEEGIDVMLVIGTKLTDMSLAGFREEHFPKRVIHFDYDQTFIGKTIDVPTLFIQGDLKRNLQLIISEMMRRGLGNDSASIRILEEERVINHDLKRNLQQLLDEMNRRGQAIDAELLGVALEQASSIEQYDQGDWLSSKTCMEVMNDVLPSESIIFGDAGSHSYYAIKYLDIKQPGTFFFDDVFGAMGYAIGYSIGAKLAAPNKKVICLTGDGCMFMHGAEVSTAVNSNAPVIFIVMNNSGLDMVDKGMKNMTGKSVGTTYSHPVDIYQFALSMGALPYKCRTAEEFKHSLQTALGYNKAVVIEVLVDPDEVPPTMRRTL
ncbi:thiamine pyrophosphate-binding protein [Bacillus salitolerans]|uniref:Thiamine pyrophosphate-binding protein n=1 Tax=Bacillus salitolerans TaxID=1437434 RepID=A0ABW4LRZ4_9BACI